MRIDASRALGGYAAVATAACLWLALGGAAANDARLRTLDVERINVREPDGTLRLVISNTARAPGIIVGKTEYPHPSRQSAGLLFYNDEGIENGGLIFDGRKVDGRPRGGGSLTFDRYLQDQVVQVIADEDGPARLSGVRVFDRPDGPLDLARTAGLKVITPGPARDAAIARANAGGAARGFFGRATDGSSRVDLRDAAGKVRLSLAVQGDGTAAIEFRDAAGRVVRRVGAD
jgi:hypothetical protein